MIKTRSELKKVLFQDCERNSEICGKRMLFEYLKGNYRAYIKYRFLKALRYMEYYENGSGLKKIFYLFYKHYFQRLQVKTQLFIHPNTIDAGLNIEHPGFIWVDSSSRIGKNCTLLPRVLFGKKKPDVEQPCIFVGDNCFIGTGATILGPVTIGNNVVIAAGSVVISNVPDDCMVAGNPARVKKFFSEHKDITHKEYL